MPYRQNQDIEKYKADQLYQAKLAELQGDRYRADMHYKAAVDAARIQAQAQNYKTDKETGFKEKELNANKAAKEWSDYGTFLDKKATNKNTREGHLIQGIGAVAKLQGDRKLPNAFAEKFAQGLETETVMGDNGKPRRLTNEEKKSRMLEFISRQSGGTDNLLEMLTGALGSSLGGQQRAIPSVQGTLSSTHQVQAGNTAANASSNAVGGVSATSTTSRDTELGQPVKQASLAPGQNWLNPTVPQDKSVPPQGLPYEPNTPEDRALDQFIKAGISPAQAPYAVKEFKDKGIEGVTNPTSATHEDLIAKLHGQQPLKLTPEQRKAFDNYLTHTQGYNVDTPAMKSALQSFLADPNNLTPTQRVFDTQESPVKPNDPRYWITNKTLTRGTMDFARRYDQWNGEPLDRYYARMDALRQAEEASGMPRWEKSMKQERDLWNAPDAEWFRQKLPVEEFGKMQNRLLNTQGPGYQDILDQGWGNVVPLSEPSASRMSTDPVFEMTRDERFANFQRPPVIPPQEESGIFTPLYNFLFPNKDTDVERWRDRRF